MTEANDIDRQAHDWFAQVDQISVLASEPPIVRQRTETTQRKRLPLLAAAAAAIIIAVTAGVLVATNGGSEQQVRTVTPPDGSQLVGQGTDPTVAATSHPIGPPDSDRWLAGRVPPGWLLARVETSDVLVNGVFSYQSYYRYQTRNDPYDAELTVTADAGAVPLKDGEATTVRGHPAVRIAVRDDGKVYATALSWHERSDLTITVQGALEGEHPVSESELRLVAENVIPIDTDRWEKLITITRPSQGGQVTPGMDRVTATAGKVEGDQWVLTALIPAGYPLLAEDDRPPCLELSFRGEQTRNSRCAGSATWERLGDVIFLAGEAPAAVAKVRLTPEGGTAIEIETYGVPELPDVRFWAAPLPEGSCLVDVAAVGNANTSAFADTFGQAFPIGNDDQLRCLAERPSEPAAPGAVDTMPVSPPG